MFVGGGATVPIISLLLSTVAWAVMCMSGNARRKSPMKWNLLLLFTVGEAISVGFISSFYQFKSVISAMMSTGAATLAVSLYTVFQNNPKYDLTQWGAGLSS
jgi:FtsH-binding integral membrane protein